MNGRKNYDSIPTDLIPEILLRLPGKSIARFRCVSKLWLSILTRPRLLVALERANEEMLFFSSPHPQNPYDNPYDKPSPVVAADFLMKFVCPELRAFTSGLIYLCSNERYDPLNKQFKVLFMAYLSGPDDHRILTLGPSKKKKWRKIKCRLIHQPLYDRVRINGICINGVLYYIGKADGYTAEERPYMIICFDVRSEKFKFLCMWILEDVERKEWSKYVYTLPLNNIRNVFVVGVITTGEIVLSGKVTSTPFCVFYFSPERNTLQRVEIRGVGEYHEAFETECTVRAFVDYVVDSKFIT
ncbi:BnaC03g65860D [Brassica napus]|uniref:BnaC03g65860D protein n=1 Tax=Brassica napus TaxID=3708 RepID=A0A078FXL7_BRANA|nr:BnaC03g65860D [Brassica napus]